MYQHPFPAGKPEGNSTLEAAAVKAEATLTRQSKVVYLLVRLLQFLEIRQALTFPCSYTILTPSNTVFINAYKADPCPYVT